MYPSWLVTYMFFLHLSIYTGADFQLMFVKNLKNLMFFRQNKFHLNAAIVQALSSVILISWYIHTNCAIPHGNCTFRNVSWNDKFIQFLISHLLVILKSTQSLKPQCGLIDFASHSQSVGSLLALLPTTTCDQNVTAVLTTKSFYSLLYVVKLLFPFAVRLHLGMWFIFFSHSSPFRM